MTQFARNRSNILTPEERAKSARKCLELLATIPKADREKNWSVRDQSFFKQQEGYAKSGDFRPSEPVLQWLRDMVSHYVTD